MKLPAIVLWAGTEAAHDALVEAAEEYAARKEAGTLDDLLPPLLQVQDGVGVISISGPLMSGSAGFMRLFGVTGYDDIADALVQGVSNKDVKAFLLSVDSGGGAVAGVQDLADMIANVDKIKPVVTHTGGMMASAAIWLGASGRKVFATQTSEVGSIGVLAIHAERSKALEQSGTKVTITRAGKYKALANPYEPLSDAAKAEIQKKVDTLHGIFLSHMAERRGVSALAAKNKFGQGQTFLGQDAVSVGLIDGVSSYAEALASAKAEIGKPVKMRRSMSKPVDEGKSASYTPAQSGIQHMNLTAQQLAALAEGVPLAEVLAMTSAAEPTAEELAAAAEAAAKAEADAKAAADAEAAAKAEADAKAAEDKPEDKPAPKAAEPKSDVVVFLTGEVQRLQDQLVTAKAEIHTLTTQATEAKASHQGLLDIARASLAKMSVALGGSGTVAETLSPTELLAEHQRLSEAFKAKFKVGGVAAVQPSAEEDKPSASVSPLFVLASQRAAG